MWPRASALDSRLESRCPTRSRHINVGWVPLAPPVAPIISMARRGVRPEALAEQRAVLQSSLRMPRSAASLSPVAPCDETNGRERKHRDPAGNRSFRAARVLSHPLSPHRECQTGQQHAPLLRRAIWTGRLRRPSTCPDASSWKAPGAGLWPTTQARMIAAERTPAQVLTPLIAPPRDDRPEIAAVRCRGFFSRRRRCRRPRENT